MIREERKEIEGKIRSESNRMRRRKYDRKKRTNYDGKRRK